MMFLFTKKYFFCKNLDFKSCNWFSYEASGSALFIEWSQYNRITVLTELVNVQLPEIVSFDFPDSLGNVIMAVYALSLMGTACVCSGT